MSEQLERCPKRDKGYPTPPSFPLELARTHPRYRSYLEPGARCVLDAGHEGRHRAGSMIWHDPPALYVGGRPFEPPTGAWRLFGELVHPAEQPQPSP